MSIPGRRKWWQWLFPTHGNWGGPGWSAGQWNPAITDWECEAVGPMDELFKTHDYAYQHNQDLDAADAKLVASLRQLSVTGVREQLYRSGAIVCFTVWPGIRWACRVIFSGGV